MISAVLCLQPFNNSSFGEVMPHQEEVFNGMAFLLVGLSKATAS